MAKVINTANFYGHEVSPFGKQHNRVDYGTLSKAFDAVLCNDIVKLFFSDINGECSEVDQVNGFIDYSGEIEELENQIEELEEISEGEFHNELERLKNELEELEELSRYEPTIYQYYIISDSGASILENWTDEIVYYVPALDIHVWGVTHFGTSWDYVLTDIRIEAPSC